VFFEINSHAILLKLVLLTLNLLCHNLLSLQSYLLSILNCTIHVLPSKIRKNINEKLALSEKKINNFILIYLNFIFQAPV